MFVDLYKILKENAEADIDSREEPTELEKADAEEELMNELEDAEEVEDAVEYSEEMVPVVSQEAAGTTRFYIEAGTLLKYMKASKKASLKEAFEDVKDANAADIDENKTYLVIDTDEICKESVEVALAFIREAKSAGIKLLKTLREEKEEDEESEDDDKKSKKSEDDHGDDCDCDECKKAKKSDDDEEDPEDDKKSKKSDDEDDDKKAKKSDDDEEDPEDDKKSKKSDDEDDDKKAKKEDLKDELEEIEDLKENFSFSAAMIPVVLKEVAGSKKFLIDYYSLNKLMKSNNISIKEAYAAILEENEENIEADNTAIVVDPEDIPEEETKDAANNVKAAKEAGIVLLKYTK